MPNSLDFALAALVEVFEFINKIGKFKWWKHNHSYIKEEILDELADVMAFFLSYVISFPNYMENLEELDLLIQEYIEGITPFDSLQILRNMTANILSEMPQTMPLIMAECIVIAAEAIETNWEEIEDAYIKKSMINIKRQEENY